MRDYSLSSHDPCCGHRLEISRLESEVRRLNYELGSERRKNQHGCTEDILSLMSGLLLGTVIYAHLLSGI